MSPAELVHHVAQTLPTLSSPEEIERFSQEIRGRKGLLTQELRALASLPEDARKIAGQEINDLKQAIDELFSHAEKAAHTHRLAQLAEAERIDISEPAKALPKGHLHPVSRAIAEITDLFTHLGFVRVIAPDVDSDFYAFESLNMPKDHPARDEWETFFVADGEAQTSRIGDSKIVLTPHTSNAQVREMQKGVLPIRMINLNRTYRRQSDVSHIPMFHQFEGLMVDKGLTIGNLKAVLESFAKAFFGEDRTIRLRPHHFRFTEPSFEIDISCGVCKGDASVGCRLCKAGWLELGGAGMVHPNVLRAGGLDPDEVSGCAFGWGIERTFLMREGLNIDDIRVLYRPDLRFVNQFV